MPAWAAVPCWRARAGAAAGQQSTRVVTGQPAGRGCPCRCACARAGRRPPEGAASSLASRVIAAAGGADHGPGRMGSDCGHGVGSVLACNGLGRFDVVMDDRTDPDADSGAGGVRPWLPIVRPVERAWPGSGRTTQGGTRHSIAIGTGRHAHDSLDQEGGAPGGCSQCLADSRHRENSEAIAFTPLGNGEADCNWALPE